MLSRIIGFAKGLLPTGGSLAIYAIVALAIAGGSAFVTHRFDTATLNALKLSYAAAEKQAIMRAKDDQYAADQVALNAAVAEGDKQRGIAVRTQRSLNEVRRHVKELTRSCITYGLVRVLDAAVLGADADELALPAGKSDDACAPVTADALASSVIENYGVAEANAEQLNALQDFVRGLYAVIQHGAH